MLDLTSQLDKFKLAHYANADFDFFSKKVISLFNKFNRINRIKHQNTVVLDLYTTYLQICEILFINANALSVSLGRFPSALFIKSDNLRLFIKENFVNKTKLSAWFFDNLIFSLRRGDKDYKESYILYENLIKEVANDYLKNFELLNAYKHGYRINAKHNKTVLSIATKDGEHFKLDESDSTITYFSKEYDDVRGKSIIFEHVLNFKINRVFAKAIFICALLDNIKTTSLIYYKKIGVKKAKAARFYIDDQEIWRKSFGGSHIKKPIFELAK